MISVIIPVYNRRQVVGRAIRSVLAQTWTEREVVVVDDCSDDGGPAWIRSQFGAAVRLLVQPRNRGVSAARNRAIEAARGEWLAFLDSDDEWLPPKLEKQMEALRAARLQVCHTDEIWVRRGVRVNPHKHHRKFGGDIFLKALPRCIMSPSSILLHRDVLKHVGCFDETLPVCEDYDLFLRLAWRYRVAFLEEPLLVKYGGHEDQLSRAYFAMDRFRVRALDKLLLQAVDLSPEKREAARLVLLEKARIVCKGAQKRNNHALLEEMEPYLERWQGTPQG